MIFLRFGIKLSQQSTSFYLVIFSSKFDSDKARKSTLHKNFNLVLFTGEGSDKLLLIKQKQKWCLVFDFTIASNPTSHIFCKLKSNLFTSVFIFHNKGLVTSHCKLWKKSPVTLEYCRVTHLPKLGLKLFCWSLDANLFKPAKQPKTEENCQSKTLVSPKHLLKILNSENYSYKSRHNQIKI